MPSLEGVRFHPPPLFFFSQWQYRKGFCLSQDKCPAATFPTLTRSTLCHSWKEDEWQDKSWEHERGRVKWEWCVRGGGGEGVRPRSVGIREGSFRIYELLCTEWRAYRHTQILTWGAGWGGGRPPRLLIGSVLQAMLATVGELTQANWWQQPFKLQIDRLTCWLIICFDKRPRTTSVFTTIVITALNISCIQVDTFL